LKNNYLIKDEKIEISYTDISTGEVNSTHLNEDKLVEEIAKIHPTEIIANDIKTLDKIRTIASLSNIYINENFDERYLDSKILTEYFEKDYLSSLKLDDSELISSSLCIILNYIYNTQKQVTSNINSINIYNSQEYMVLDMFTRNNLELPLIVAVNSKL
ncbi:DNA mismatch repair protein MutS, partial [Paeniclostridium sordellii]|nr:DNA mismatch repair protein MutS [Paeniclostridium sordellii]